MIKANISNCNIKEWTLFFLIYIKPNEELNDVISIKFEADESARLINDILLINPHKNVNTLICIIASSDYFKKNKLPFDTSVNQDKSVAVFYSVSHNTSKNINELQLHYCFQDFDIRKPEDVKKVLEKQILQRFRSKKNILFTWDHGSVYGIFKKGIVEDGPLKIKEFENDFSLVNVIKENIIKDNEVDIQPRAGMEKKDMLTIHELKETIKEVFKSTKLDILVMMNCYMQVFDTGFELRNQVRYLIAPETYIYMNGYNYQAFLKKLNYDPKISSKKIAKLIVSSFKTKYIDNIRLKDEILNSVTISLFDLAYFERIAHLLNSIAIILYDFLEDEDKFDIIKESRNKCGYIPYTLRFFITDMKFFFQNLSTRLNDKRTNKKIDSIQRLFNLSLKKIHVGRKISNISNPIETKGISIFFPEYSNQIKSMLYDEFVNENKPEATEFVKSNKWDQFVLAFAKKNGLPPIPL
jgi:hypothetical protein